ncbi:DUF2884 family protein [Photobacterium kishitanii]|uniref:DUF2884 family protein n=1 Tax=Photobacterium kishitanii TaxID=318456 RepID=UPI0007F8D61E|nr:DUF2884 family protein [Photobacterium kishitanii]OBU30100.1 hypothetical protein AYY23_22055 [Photobacterium kishitanii]PSW49103.1 DUF2884 domain-containing protein [Photobacterium kishitanii]
MKIKLYIKNGCGLLIGLSISSAVAAVAAVAAVECQPLWHNNLSFTDEKLILEHETQTFTIKDNGQLYFDIHKVNLNPEQSHLLAQYYQIIATDLPYVLSHGQRIDTQLCDFAAVRIDQENQIRQHIPALKNWHSVSLE